MQVIEYTSTKLYDYHTGVNGVYLSPLVSLNPHIRFIFCMAEPAAPFIKLSEAESATIRLVFSSMSKPTSQKLEPTTNFGSGNLYRPFLSRINLTKGSPLYALRYIFHSSSSSTGLFRNVWLVVRMPLTMLTAWRLMLTLICLFAISESSCSISPVCLCFAGL